LFHIVALLVTESGWNLKTLGFAEGGKPENLDSNPEVLRSGGPTTNSTHIWHEVQELNQSHHVEKLLLSLLRCTTHVSPGV
jgi:hypothetical protein